MPDTTNIDTIVDALGVLVAGTTPRRRADIPFRPAPDADDLREVSEATRGDWARHSRQFQIFQDGPIRYGNWRGACFPLVATVLILIRYHVPSAVGGFIEARQMMGADLEALTVRIVEPDSTFLAATGRQVADVVNASMESTGRDAYLTTIVAEIDYDTGTSNA